MNYCFPIKGLFSVGTKTQYGKYLLVGFYHHCPCQLPHQNHHQNLHKLQTNWQGTSWNTTDGYSNSLVGLVFTTVGKHNIRAFSW